MAANSMIYWDAGFPFNGAEDSNSPGSMVFWDAGSPFVWLTPSAGIVVNISVLSLLGVG